MTPTLATVDDPASPVSEAYRALRTRILVAAERQGLGTILVTSPTAGNGRSAAAANLAVSLARVGKRVVLLSGDLSSSVVHQYFGLADDRGVSNVLTGELPPGAVVQESAGLERLWVLGSGPLPAQPAELLQSESMLEGALIPFCVVPPRTAQSSDLRKYVDAIPSSGPAQWHARVIRDQTVSRGGSEGPMEARCADARHRCNRRSSAGRRAARTVA